MNQFWETYIQRIYTELSEEFLGGIDRIDKDELKFHARDCSEAAKRFFLSIGERRQKVKQDRRDYRELLKCVRLLQRSEEMSLRYRLDNVRLEFCRRHWEIANTITGQHINRLIKSGFIRRRPITFEKSLKEIHATIRTAAKREQAHGTRSPETCVDNSQQYVVGHDSAGQERSYGLSAQNVSEENS